MSVYHVLGRPSITSCSCSLSCQVLSSPAVSSDGTTVYVGSDDNLYAINAADGALKHNISAAGNTPGVSLDMDGVVHSVSSDGFLVAHGLSAGHLIRGLHAAQMAISANDTVGALAQLDRIFGLRNATLPPPPPAPFVAACQVSIHYHVGI